MDRLQRLLWAYRRLRLSQGQGAPGDIQDGKHGKLSRKVLKEVACDGSLWSVTNWSPEAMRDGSFEVRRG
jgi:hypothetical protein